MAFYTYILASQRNGTLYVGSTDALINRVVEHRDKIRSGFRAWKLELIERFNPGWRDLFDDLL